ncbi:MAG TPA: peptide chain release factor N(5)-glutamine methyltransferase, partial [Luteitalea sp.]|nr:peptide chain release factor N(5)-glutamine methyltransferase [Luteitalea sp.]
AALDARNRLREARVGWASADLDAEVLARHVLGWDRAAWITRSDGPAHPEFLDAYEAAIARRLGREPVAYIVGAREFYGRDFIVSPSVLVPRPETELIVEWVLKTVPATPSPRVVDVGTGSGAMAVTLAAERPSWQVLGTDISSEALDVARANADALGVGDRVTFVVGDLLAPAQGEFDLIVSNPPYVARRDAPGMLPDVRDHEPHVALFGGQDGLDLPRRLLVEASTKLTPGGWIAMEFGYGQADTMADAATAAGLEVVEVLCDLQGIERTLVARL